MDDPPRRSGEFLNPRRANDHTKTTVRRSPLCRVLSTSGPRSEVLEQLHSSKGSCYSYSSQFHSLREILAQKFARKFCRSLQGSGFFDLRRNSNSYSKLSLDKFQGISERYVLRPGADPSLFIRLIWMCGRFVCLARVAPFGLQLLSTHTRAHKRGVTLNYIVTATVLNSKVELDMRQIDGKWT